MFTINRILFVLTALVALSSISSAFFLNWGAPETSPAPYYYYHQRLLGGPYSVPGTEPPPVPAQLPSVPIQVPLQAQLQPSSSIHNVQLVPCLCPVSQEMEVDKVPQENSVFYTTTNQHKTSS